MIDLHTHTTRSDGTDTPAELLALARGIGLEALAITDHDTITEVSDPLAIRGIEVGARGFVHVLGYFFDEPGQEFLTWLAARNLHPRDRIREMAARLQGLGFDVTAEEAEALGARSTCRPHFARLLVRKGYVQSMSEAFQKYLGEGGPAYVERDDPEPEEAIEYLRAGGAVPSLAHPVHVEVPDLAVFVARLARAGLCAIEAFHPDHSPADTRNYLALAQRLDLAITGGSDYHGANKPGIHLGTGRGNVDAPLALLDDLRRRAARL
ncbi:MAG: PHP domain-containing protein [Bryobacterales bacterium]|nr:PHP domain-containing protein [Bryobacterales bacterium]